MSGRDVGVKCFDELDASPRTLHDSDPVSPFPPSRLPAFPLPPPPSFLLPPSLLYSSAWQSP